MATEPDAGSDAAVWKAWFEEILVARSGLDPDRAMERALAQAEGLWHRLHHEVRPNWCPGCAKPLGTAPSYHLGDHQPIHVDCTAAYGEAWRSRARAGLRKLGIP